MFPLTPAAYIKIATTVLVVLAIWYNGYRVGYSNLTEYKAEQIVQTRAKELAHQADKDKIESEKNAQIAIINAQLVNAISELRKRPSRPQATDNSETGTGAGLYAEDSIFLTGEAAGQTSSAPDLRPATNSTTR